MKNNNKKGFTLVELVIVVAVMAILVAVAIPTVGSIAGSATAAVNDSNARTIESIIKLAEAEASKNSNGVVELKEQDIADAIAEAKLGITSGNFYYNAKTGTVSTATSTGAITISFSTSQVKVGSKTASLEVTPAATEG